MFSNDALANGVTGGYERGGRLYLSRTLVNDVLSGSGGLRFGLFHEITHIANFQHTAYSRLKPNVSGANFARSRSFSESNYRDPYAYQGFLESVK